MIFTWKLETGFIHNNIMVCQCYVAYDAFGSQQCHNPLMQKSKVHPKKPCKVLKMCIILETWAESLVKKNIQNAFRKL